jgi:aminoglycoside phosphotransferase (APT) family kinase protein
MSVGTPPAEHVVDEALVRALLEAQHPDLAALPIRLIDAGWDNAMFRLGEALAVRLPRRQVSAQLVLNEQRWLPVLAPRLPLPIPAPVRTGVAGCGYPWAWSLVPWITGESADLAPPAPDQAARLAAFLRALHQRAPTSAPANPVRGVPLASRAETVEERLHRLEGKTALVTPAIWRIWREALAAQTSDMALWLHGDLHARNVLVEGGALCGVIDWGDITAGDPATDVASIWMLFEEPGAHAAAMAAYGGGDPDLWARARGWAVLFATFLLDTGLIDHPRHAAMGETIFRRLA